MAHGIGRRSFLASSVAFAGLTTLSARRVMAAGDSIRMMFWGSQIRADLTYRAADLFTEKTGNAVAGEFMGWGDYWQKLATQVAGGNAPDVIQMDYNYLIQYASRNAIAPLDDLLVERLRSVEFDPDQLAGGKVNEQLHGVSLGSNTAATAFNIAVFEEAGIEVPDNSWTLDRLVEIGEAFKAADIRRGMRAIGDCTSHEAAFENWLLQRGKTLYTADGRLGYEQSDMAEWFAFWQMMRDNDFCVSAEDQVMDSGGIETSMIVAGKAAIHPTNSNQLAAVQALMQDPVGICGYPRASEGSGGGHYRKPAMLFSIADSSGDKELAAEFIHYFVSNPEAAAILSVERGIPCTPAAREAAEPTLDEIGRVTLDYVANLGDLLGTLPPAPPSAAGEITSSLLSTVSQELLFGRREPEDAAAYFFENANAMLERAR